MVLRGLRLVGSVLGLLAYWVGVRRSVVHANLLLALPDNSENSRRKIARASFRNLGIVFLEFLYLRFASKRAIQERLEIENLGIVNDELQSGKGAILLSGHCGNWEWTAVAMGLRLGNPLRLVVKNQRSKGADRFLETVRCRFGNTKVDAGNARGIFAALRNHECLGILSDQAAPTSSVRIPFFGVEVPAFEGVARLALRSRVPIYFLHIVRRPSGYHVMIEQIKYEDLRDTSDASVRELTIRHTRVLEASIRRHPELWLWQHRRWKYA